MDQPAFLGELAGLARLVNETARAALTSAGLCATWSAVQVNVDSIAERHVDDGCVGLSLVLLVGPFCRGAFKTKDLILRDPGWLLAFGSDAHSSEEFSGRRYALVMHTVTPTTLDQQAAARLLAVGFPLPGAAAVPRAPPHLRLLYLFAGPERKASIGNMCAEVFSSMRRTGGCLHGGGAGHRAARRHRPS